MVNTDSEIPVSHPWKYILSASFFDHKFPLWPEPLCFDSKEQSCIFRFHQDLQMGSPGEMRA